MNFIQQAYKGKNSLWRIILTLLFTLMGWQVIGIIPILITAVLKTPNLTKYESVLSNLVQGKDIDSNLYLLLMITSFAVGLLFLTKGVQWFHKRDIKSLLTSRKKYDWQRTFLAFGLWFAISLSLIAIDYFIHPNNYVWNFQAVPFIILVLIAFFLLPLQTSFEEILFRGYLMQTLGVLTKNRWFPLLFTSIVFGLLHAANPETEKLGAIVMIYYIGTGFLFGIITLLDEGIEISLGLHAANNIVAAVFVTTNWTVFQTDALFMDISKPDLTLQMYIPVFVIYPLLLLILSKKYAWKNWKNKLTGKIIQPPILSEDKSLSPNLQD